MNKIRKTK